MSMQKYMPQGEGETPIVEASPDMCAAATHYKTCVENGRSQCPDSQSVTIAEMMIKQFESLCGDQYDKVTSTTSSYTKETEENLKRGSNKRRTLAELKKENLILDNERLREETKRLKLEQENLKLEKEGIILKNRCLICKVQTEYPDCVAP
ncbi:uncharacterized protein LOC134716123 [Mytilus trossulus]|uniref:uncharacterized protein LOC134716123 n=1 Tax=Mytilus trossulus TaxID=6551 RepID=UPI003007F1D9